MNYYPRRNNFQGGFANQNGNGRRQYKDNQGKAWRNTNATKPNSPHFKGAMQVAGVEYWVSIWFNSSPDRGDEISIKVNPKQEARRDQYQQQQNNGFAGYAQAPQGHSFSFAPNQPPQPRQPYNAGPQRGFAPQGYPQQGQPQQPPAAPPANGPADYGMEGYPTEEDDFPGF